MAKTFDNIPLSVLELATVIEGSTPSESFQHAQILAQKVEQLGYKRFWLAEHHNMISVASSATAVLIGYIAAATSTIRVGSGGIMLPNHAPLIVAEQFGTLESIYPGRIDLGLGRAPGTDQVTIRALRRDLMAGMDFPAHVAELRKYFSDQNHTALVRAIPGEGLDIPIWILGSSADSAHLAAALGLPYAFASHFAPSQLKAALEIYRLEFRPSDQLNKPYVMACVNIIAADNDETANYLATSFQKLFLGIIKGERKLLQKPDENFELDIMEEMALQQMARYSFIGGPVTVKNGLQQFIAEHQVDELMAVTHVYDHEARVHSYELLKAMQS